MPDDGGFDPVEELADDPVGVWDFPASLVDVAGVEVAGVSPDFVWVSPLAPSLDLSAFSDSLELLGSFSLLE